MTFSALLLTPWCIQCAPIVNPCLLYRAHKPYATCDKLSSHTSVRVAVGKYCEVRHCEATASFKMFPFQLYGELPRSKGEDFWWCCETLAPLRDHQRMQIHSLQWTVGAGLTSSFGNKKGINSGLEQCFRTTLEFTLATRRVSIQDSSSALGQR